MSLLSLNTYGDETKKTPPTCSDVIAACDKAIDAQKKQIIERDKIVEILQNDKKQLETQVEEKQKSLEKYCRNPFVTGSVAAAAGSLAVVVNPVSLLIGAGVVALSCLF